MILTADPRFAGAAWDELRQMRPTAQVQQELAPGVLLVNAPDGFFALAEEWRQQPPIFVRHICPVMLILDAADPALDQRLTAEFGSHLDPAATFAVQTRVFGAAPYKPFDLNKRLAAAYQQATGAPLDVRHPAQIVSVVGNGRTLYAGISPAVYNLSNWAGGARRFAREPGQISRAEFKLLEAIEHFAIPLRPQGRALDLGAAPGGWTRVLHQRQQVVTAVDPAQLHPSLLNQLTIHHKPITAEAYLAAGPGTYDLIVNDMRQDARDSARLMVRYGDYLDGQGTAVITLKLPEQGYDAIITAAFNILAYAYALLGARHLFHNRSEITVYLKLKGDGETYPHPSPSTLKRGIADKTLMPFRQKSHDLIKLLSRQ